MQALPCTSRSGSPSLRKMTKGHLFPIAEVVLGAAEVVPSYISLTNRQWESNTFSLLCLTAYGPTGLCLLDVANSCPFTCRVPFLAASPPIPFSNWSSHRHLACPPEAQVRVETSRGRDEIASILGQLTAKGANLPPFNQTGASSVADPEK